MAEFKTPTTKRYKSKLNDNPEFQTPIKIPASPFLEKIGYGCGVSVFMLERSPKVGFTRSPWAIKKRNSMVPKNETKYDERIRFEAEILRKLNHPNIIGFRALTETSDGEPCLAMEKLDRSLGDLIEDRCNAGDDPFPPGDILKVGYEIIKGLEYLHHTVHILHGDVKSFNILISHNRSIVKLCDFGVSVPLKDSLEIDTRNGSFQYIGTECWSAPEVIFEDNPITNKADIWAYGLVLWEMLALSPPHVNCEDSMTDSSFDRSELSENDMSFEKENLNPDSEGDESILCLNTITKTQLGTRPPLPAINLGVEYQEVLELLYVCTTADYNLRPSAKGIVEYFKNSVKM